MPRTKRKPKDNWSHSNTPILGNKADIFKLTQSGDVWQFRMWVPNEKKYIRKSLRTRDFQSAQDQAEKMVYEAMSDIHTGRKIFGITLQELCDKYLEWRQEDVEVGNITAGRFGTIRTQLRHFMNFRSPNLRVAELNTDSYYDYANWRKKEYSKAADVTIRNEHSTINHMISYGYREGLCHFEKMDFRKIKIRQDQVGKRDTFTLEEYDQLIYFLRSYTSKKHCPNEEERLERKLVQDCLLIGSNTLLRVGELWQLKWGDITKITQDFDETEQAVHLVHLNVRAETSKRRASRPVITRGGQYFTRLKSRSTHTTKDDLVFTEINSPKPLSKKKWYLHWKNLMEGIDLDYKARNVTWYSLRHFGIICRIRAGNRYAEIGKLAGTSVTFLETHYVHYDEKMLRTAALKNFSVNRDGIQE